MKRRTKAALTLVVSVISVVVVAAGAGYSIYQKQLAAEAARQAQIEEQQRLEAQQEAERKAAEEAEAARLEAERRAEEERLAREAAEAQAKAEAAAAKETVQTGDCIGTVWVEGTQVNCNLYWGDSTREFRLGAGCDSTENCVMPGENGTVFVGGHTDSWFVDLKSAQMGAIIHLDTLWGNFEYRIVDAKVIYDTQIEACRWGDTEPNCILYTCYPFGIQVPTNQRYLVYADPVQTDENGVIPSSYPGLQEPIS